MIDIGELGSNVRTIPGRLGHAQNRGRKVAEIVETHVGEVETGCVIMGFLWNEV